MTMFTRGATDSSWPVVVTTKMLFYLMVFLVVGSICNDQNFDSEAFMTTPMNVVSIAPGGGTESTTRTTPSPRRSTSTKHYMGFFDNLKLIMSEEGKKNIAAYNEREREQQEAAQREILERRNNPEKMKQYEMEIAANRDKLQKERDVWQFQNKIEQGFDPLKEWNTLRSEGKIQVGSDLPRDQTSRRLNSDGLVDVRTDERLPYIDQGYVDEDADFMGKLFGGKKQKKESPKENDESPTTNNKKQGGWPW